MTRIDLRAGIGVSLAALGVTWFVTGVAFSLCYRDTKALYAFLIWSVPFFAVGWVILGIPMIALSDRLPRMPGFSLILSIIGALVGGMIMFAPAAIARWTSPQVHYVPFAWTDFAGWPAFGTAIGAAGLLIYSWLLSVYVSSGKASR